MNNAINNQFKMKMGSKQKDTEGNFSEKDTTLMKKAPLLNISSVLADDPGAPKDKFKAMGDAFDAGKKEGVGMNLTGGGKKEEEEPQGGTKVDYSKKFGDIASQAGKDAENIDLLGSVSGLIG